jgi:hypothetical protein
LIENTLNRPRESANLGRASALESVQSDLFLRLLSVFTPLRAANR